MLILAAAESYLVVLLQDTLTAARETLMAYWDNQRSSNTDIESN
jgi:hypothetical protein